MIINKALYVILIYFCTFAPSYAYLDPGSAGSLLQVIVAAIAGAVVSIGFYWQKLKNFIKKTFSYKKKNKKIIC
mgnify:CR=1 FL=1